MTLSADTFIINEKFINSLMLGREILSRPI